MRAPIKFLLAALAGLALSAAAGAGAAVAGGCGCTPPPPCCAPPSPPPPPSYPCCQPPGHTVNVPGVNVFVGATVVVNAAASAQAGAGASAAGGATVFFGGGGGGGGYAVPGPQGLVQGLNVEGGMLKRVAYEATRKITRRVVIQAVCLDDKDVPHPASQTTPDRDIEDSFDGEIYRCIAGARMQATIAEYDGHIDFGHGRVIACDKAQALYHSPGGVVECRAQKPARDCNERSLLRRFGAGVKILTMITVEKYTAYREETVRTSSATTMSLDGGVGGIMY